MWARTARRLRPQGRRPSRAAGSTTPWPSRMIADHRGIGGQPQLVQRPSDGRPRFGQRDFHRSMMRPPSRRISRTRSPTVTASSTIAVRMCGGETAASTPHCSVNSHSFFGPIDSREHPGNGELLLGQERRDQVVLVVAGRRDDDLGLRQFRALEHPRLAGVPQQHVHLGRPLPCLVDDVRASSISVTSCPRSARSAARWRPTAPAPVTTTRISAARSPTAARAPHRAGPCRPWP